MSERELTAQNVGELLGLTPKPQADEPSSEVDVNLTESPEPAVRDIPDTNDDDVGELKRAVEQQEQRDAALWAAGVPPARSAAQQREDERAFIGLIHKQPEDAALTGSDAPRSWAVFRSPASSPRRQAADPSTGTAAASRRRQPRRQSTGSVTSPTRHGSRPRSTTAPTGSGRGSGDERRRRTRAAPRMLRGSVF